jgi:hypothetical protein
MGEEARPESDNLGGTAMKKEEGYNKIKNRFLILAVIFFLWWTLCMLLMFCGQYAFQ